MKFKLLILSLLFSFIFIYAGTESKQQGINVTAMASKKPFTNSELKIIEAFKNNIKNKGLLDSKSPRYEIMLTFKDMGSSKTIVSVMILQIISENIVALGGENEVFYSELTMKNKKPSQKYNDDIRKYVSEEYMRQFRQILDSSIYILDSENIDKEADRILTEVFKMPFLEHMQN